MKPIFAQAVVFGVVSMSEIYASDMLDLSNDLEWAGKNELSVRSPYQNSWQSPINGVVVEAVVQDNSSISTSANEVKTAEKTNSTAESDLSALLGESPKKEAKTDDLSALLTESPKKEAKTDGDLSALLAQPTKDEPKSDSNLADSPKNEAKSDDLSAAAADKAKNSDLAVPVTNESSDGETVALVDVDGETVVLVDVDCETVDIDGETVALVDVDGETVVLVNADGEKVALVAADGKEIRQNVNNEELDLVAADGEAMYKANGGELDIVASDEKELPQNAEGEKVGLVVANGGETPSAPTLNASNSDNIATSAEPTPPLVVPVELCFNDENVFVEWPANLDPREVLITTTKPFTIQQILNLLRKANILQITVSPALETHLEDLYKVQFVKISLPQVLKWISDVYREPTNLKDRQLIL